MQVKGVICWQGGRKATRGEEGDPPSKVEKGVGEKVGIRAATSGSFLSNLSTNMCFFHTQIQLQPQCLFWSHFTAQATQALMKPLTQANLPLNSIPPYIKTRSIIKLRLELQESRDTACYCFMQCKDSVSQIMQHSLGAEPISSKPGEKPDHTFYIWSCLHSDN